MKNINPNLVDKKASRWQFMSRLVHIDNRISTRRFIYTTNEITERSPDVARYPRCLYRMSVEKIR